MNRLKSRMGETFTRYCRKCKMWVPSIHACNG